MKKKIVAIVITIVLVFSLGSIAFAAPAGTTVIPIIEVKQLAADEELVFTGTYGTDTPEYKSFDSYMGELKENQQIVTVFNLSVYNNTTSAYQPGVNYAAIPPDDTPYVFSITNLIPNYNPIPGDDYNVYMYDENLDHGDGSPLGGWRWLGFEPDKVQTKYGFGTYAVFLDAQQPFDLTQIEYDATNKYQDVAAFKRYTYGTDSQEWIDFQYYMTQNNMPGTLAEVWQINAWGDDRFWIEDNSFLANYDMSAPYVIQTQMPDYTVLYQPNAGAPIQVLGDGAAVTTQEGFGLFAFIDNTPVPAPVPVPTPEVPVTTTTVSSPKTGDTNSSFMAWCVVAIAVSVSMIFVLRKKFYTEK